MKNLVKVLQDNFRCRMIVNYVVNSPSSLTFVWKMVKGLLEQHTIRKIRILKEGRIDEMAQSFAPHQYEEKYGGTAPSPTEFWPPVMPTGPYNPINEAPEQHLTNTSSYREYFPPSKPKKSKKRKQKLYNSEPSESTSADFARLDESLSQSRLEKIIEQTCENTESFLTPERDSSEIHEESFAARGQFYSQDAESDGEASVRTLEVVMDEQYLATTQKLIFTHQSESGESPFLLEKLDRIYNREGYESPRSARNEPILIEELSESKRRQREDCEIDTSESPSSVLCGGCTHEKVMSCCMF